MRLLLGYHAAEAILPAYAAGRRLGAPILREIMQDASAAPTPTAHGHGREASEGLRGAGPIPAPQRRAMRRQADEPPSWSP
jgi:hypothetical protein